MQGIGLFETMRAYSGSVFRLQQHLDRLAASAKELGWAVVPDIGEMTDSVRQVVEATDSSDLRCAADGDHRLVAQAPGRNSRS